MTEPDHKPSFEAKMRKMFQRPIAAVARFFLSIGLKANHITLIGLLGQSAAALLIARGRFTLAGVLVMVLAPFDAVDGAMARMTGETSKFGAFLDSVTDRYEELALLGGLTFFYANHNNLLAVMLCFAAAAGSVLVSYTCARAEGLGFNGKVGLLTRVERAIVMVVGLLIAKPVYSVGIIAVLANITALQRIVSVWNQSKSKQAELGKGTLK